MKKYIFEKNGDFYKLFYPEKKMKNDNNILSIDKEEGSHCRTGKG